MDYIWNNLLGRVLPDDGKMHGECLSEDKVIRCFDGSLFRKSDLNSGKLCTVRGKITAIADLTKPHRLIGLTRFIYVRYGRLDECDGWVPDQVISWSDGFAEHSVTPRYEN